MALLMDLVKEGRHWRLSVHGSLEFRECYQFRMITDRILASRPFATVLDLSYLGKLDQAGLGALVEVSHEHADAGRQLVVVTNGAIDRLLCDERLEGLFSTAQTMAGAKRKLENPFRASLQGALVTV